MDAGGLDRGDRRDLGPRHDREARGRDRPENDLGGLGQFVSRASQAEVQLVLAPLVATERIVVADETVVAETVSTPA